MNSRRWPTTSGWTLPLGANVAPDGVRFAVWAPKARRVDVVVERTRRVEVNHWQLERGPDGVYSGFVVGLPAGSRYRFRLDSAASYPDPWSRSQPEGVHGPSEIVDSRAFQWTDAGWTGISREQLIVYELHIGAFTPLGTFDGVVDQLPALKHLGVTAIELMPVAEFPGKRNWGYDGVDLFAPSRNYGGPAGLKRLVAATHRRGLAVILDVVYNHFGPDGNYLRAFSDDYFTDDHATPWGSAINYDGPNAKRVRELVIQNACYWLVEYHLDGLRLDATHAIFDDSRPHLLAELADTARAAVGDGRQIVLIAEDDRRDIRLARPQSRGGYGLGAVWADDFHHAVHVHLTGERDGYYQAYTGAPAEIATAVRSGFVYQGQWSAYHGRPHGRPVEDDLASAFVFCVQNHDQIGNRALGERLNQLVGTPRFLVAAALLLFAPEIPLLFMGQEFAATTPFLYFTDHEPSLGALVTRGRREEFGRFDAFRDAGRRATIPDPQALETFARSVLRLHERRSNAGALRFHRDLIQLRRRDVVLASSDRATTEVTPIGDSAIAVRRWSASGSRLLIANLGERRSFDRQALPLDEDSKTRWRLLVSTTWGRYSPGKTSLHPRLTATRLDVPPETALIYSWDAVSSR